MNGLEVRAAIQPPCEARIVVLSSRNRSPRGSVVGLDDAPVVDEFQSVEGSHAAGCRMHGKACSRSDRDLLAEPDAFDSQIDERSAGGGRSTGSHGVGPALPRGRACPHLRVGPQATDGHARTHLVGATDDGNAQAAVEQAVPLARGVGVDTRPEVADLQGVDAAEGDVGDHLAVRVGEVRDDGQATPQSTVIGPIRDAGPGRVAEVRLVRPRRAEWGRDPPAGPEQRQMPQDVLAVLGPDPDERAVSTDRR